MLQKVLYPLNSETNKKRIPYNKCWSITGDHSLGFGLHTPCHKPPAPTLNPIHGAMGVQSATASSTPGRFLVVEGWHACHGSSFGMKG